MGRTRPACLSLVIAALGCGSGASHARLRAEMRAREAAEDGDVVETSHTAAPSIATLMPVVDAPENPEGGADFGEEARTLYRVVACGGTAPLPANIDKATVDAHCRSLAPEIATYRSHYVSVAAPFLHALEPDDLAKTVVYPFSGGDLATALMTYPNATEVTTLSLELAGDPRRIKSMDQTTLSVSLKKLRREVSELLGREEYSRSETLKKTQRGDIPGELSFFLVGLAIHDYEPVSLRYFTLRSDGGIHYLSAADIAAREGETADHRKATWTSPDFSEAFANSELTYRKIGDPSAPLRIHRHIAANLANDALADTPGVIAHLERKGEVAGIVKAASYLLWNDGFSTIRSFLVAHAHFIVSDSTGVPPPFATEGGLSQETYGTFQRSLLHASFAHNEEFRKLWKSEPNRALPFRYGYLDGAGHDHLLITKRKKRDPGLAPL